MLIYHLRLALDFDPDRFLDERVKTYLTHNPFIFVPFNAGPRICLGQQVSVELPSTSLSTLTELSKFAYNEMSYVLIRLLQNFSTISLDSDAQPLESQPPASWANAKGRKGIEKFRPKSHLTMYSQVFLPCYFVC